MVAFCISVQWITSAEQSIVKTTRVN